MLAERENGNGEEVEEIEAPLATAPTATSEDSEPARAAAQPERGGPSPEGPAAGEQERPKRRGGRRRRVCIMCADKIKTVDYKNVSFLRRFISDRARIDTRRKTSACAKHQRAIAQAIKRARHLALLPYTAEHIRAAQTGHR